MHLRVLAISLLAATVGLSGCSSTPSTTQAHLPGSSSHAQEVLAGTPKRKRAELALAWAEQYIEEQRYANALEMLKEISPEELSNTDHQLHWYQLKAHALLSEGHIRDAGILLDAPELKQLLEQQDATTRATFALLHADALALEGKPRESLALRFTIDSQLDSNQQQYNQELTWQLLTQLSADELQALSEQSNHNGRGWVELAELYQNKSQSLEEQIKALHQWQRRWRQHPAASQPPEDVVGLEKALRDRPKHVAVLLPEQGPVASAAHALRDGILAGYYFNTEKGHDTPELRFYDSAEEDRSIVDIYHDAVAEGAELVIGPLEKEKVIELSQQKELPVNVLSLNYHVQEEGPNNLIQFGLSPEDEAEQIARVAYQQGLTRIGILFPDNTSGERIASAFNQAWESLGGTLVDQQIYTQDASSAISRLLKVDAYQARTQRNKNISRKDMDAIFVVATAEQGRQIKPAIDFYHGNRLPIFSTSMIYDAQPNRQRNGDLNRIQFMDIPWLLSPDAELADAIQQAWPKQHGRYERIFALGVDAYQLGQRLALMKTSSYNQMQGLTGTLSLEEQRINRTLLPAKFTRGEATYDEKADQQHAPTPVIELPTAHGLSR